MDDDFDDYEDYEDFDEEPVPLDPEETALVAQDLDDLDAFEETFAAEGYRGVSVFCRDCVEDHFYPWDMLRGNLETLLETGETPVHEPAFSPDPDDYVPWEYARGYVDALHESGVHHRRRAERCSRCDLDLEGDLVLANHCPRCGAALFEQRLVQALRERVGADEARKVLQEAGLSPTVDPDDGATPDQK